MLPERPVHFALWYSKRKAQTGTRWFLRWSDDPGVLPGDGERLMLHGVLLRVACMTQAVEDGGVLAWIQGYGWLRESVEAGWLIVEPVE